MKRLFFAIFILHIFFCNSQKIIWSSSKKLTWNDFRATKNSAFSDERISSYASCGISYTLAKNKSTGKINVLIEAFFNPEKSWKSPDGERRVPIKHEQGHFDLAEVYARRLRKAFKEEIKTEKDVELKFKILYQMHYGRFLDAQNEYDRETNRGEDGNKQNEYDQKISSELQSLVRYKN